MALEISEVDAIAERTAEILASKKRAHWVDPDTHSEHHSWVSFKIQSEAERVAFWREVRTKVTASAAIWALPILIGAFALVTWEWFISRVREAAGG